MKKKKNYMSWRSLSHFLLEFGIWEVCCHDMTNGFFSAFTGPENIKFHFMTGRLEHSNKAV